MTEKWIAEPWSRRGLLGAAGLGVAAATMLAAEQAQAQIRANRMIPDGVAQHTAPAGDLTLAYLRAGTGDPIVLLHGFPQHSHMWLQMMSKLAERHLVIAPDQRGMGGSTIPSGPYDKRTMAGDLAKLLDSLSLGRVNLVGYDQGAGVAYAFAAAYPDRVRRLALAEFTFPGFGYEEFMQPRRGGDDSWQLRAFLTPDLAMTFIGGRERELLSWYFHIYCDKPSAVSPEDFEVYVRALQRPGALRAGMTYFAAIFDDSDHNKENVARGKLTMPVLYVGGVKGVGKYGSTSTRQLAANVTDVMLQESGHWPADEQPEEFARAVLDFVK